MYIWNPFPPSMCVVRVSCNRRGSERLFCCITSRNFLSYFHSVHCLQPNTSLYRIQLPTLEKAGHLVWSVWCMSRGGGSYKPHHVPTTGGVQRAALRRCDSHLAVRIDVARCCWASAIVRWVLNHGPNHAKANVRLLRNVQIDLQDKKVLFNSTGGFFPILRPRNDKIHWRLGTRVLQVLLPVEALSTEWRPAGLICEKERWASSRGMLRECHKTLKDIMNGLMTCRSHPWVYDIQVS